MCSDDAAVQQDILHIRVIGKMLKHIFPDLMVAPTGKALVDTVPVAEFLGKQSPLGCAAQDPQDGFDEQPAFGINACISPRMVLQK